MGEARRKEEIKAREDKAFGIFEAYIRAICGSDICRSASGPELPILREKMRDLINKGEVNDLDDGK